MSIATDLLDEIEKRVLRAFPDYQITPLIRDLREELDKLEHPGGTKATPAPVEAELHSLEAKTEERHVVDFRDDGTGRQVPKSRGPKGGKPPAANDAAPSSSADA